MNDPASDLPIEVFVPPSDEAQALRRLLPDFVDAAETELRGVRRWMRDALVAPFTQMTFLSFDLQMFLFDVFHTSRVARAGHLLGMLGVNFFLLAGLSEATARLPFDGGGVAAGALLCWYAAVSRDARLGLWWAAMVPVVLGLHAGSLAWLDATASMTGTLASPWIWMIISAAVVSLSHAGESHLPPRAGDPMRWMPLTEFVFGPRGDRNRPAVVARRLARMTSYSVIGTLDELWASPRLLPYNFLRLMMAAGYAPAMKAELDRRADKAWASGQPAIDFVGIGGGATWSEGRVTHVE